MRTWSTAETNASRVKRARRNKNGGEADRKTPPRLLALDDEGDAEDCGGDERHPDHSLKGDRRGGRLLHDWPKGEAEPREKKKRVNEKCEDANRHGLRMARAQRLVLDVWCPQRDSNP